MTKHTPGPWDAGDTAGHKTHGQSVVYDESGKDIAIVYDGDANAALISAAPELLAALQAFLTTFDQPNYDENHVDALERCCDEAREVIVKATGA